MYHYAEKPFELDKNRNYSDKYDNDSGGVHVKAYGLWLSVNDAWKQWAESSNFPVGKIKYKVEIEEEKVLILDTKEKVAEFNKKYSENGWIDWIRVSNEFSGIVFNPYFYKLRFVYLWYSGIDVPSACIWNLSNIKSIEEV